MTRIYFDTELLVMQSATRKEQLDVMQAGSPSWVDMQSGLTSRTDGASSPRWVNCPKCGAYRGDQCHGVLFPEKVVGTLGPVHRYCAERVQANRQRLEELDTWAVHWRTPCHETAVWLVWRTTEDKLEWQGVPCFAKDCGKTYAIERYASDMADERMPCDHINPQLVEMMCWATEETDPWA